MLNLPVSPDRRHAQQKEGALLTLVSISQNMRVELCGGRVACIAAYAQSTHHWSNDTWHVGASSACQVPRPISLRHERNSPASGEICLSYSLTVLSTLISLALLYCFAGALRICVLPPSTPPPPSMRSFAAFTCKNISVTRVFRLTVRQYSSSWSRAMACLKLHWRFIPTVRPSFNYVKW